MNDSQNQNWLVRPTTIKLLWRVFIAILALTVLAQLVIKVKGYFSVDDWFGFAADRVDHGCDLVLRLGVREVVPIKHLLP